MDATYAVRRRLEPVAHVVPEPPGVSLALKARSRQLRSTKSSSWQERPAWLLLCGVLVGVGLYILGELPARFGLGGRARDRNLAFL
jgi:hypothetical protein